MTLKFSELYFFLVFWIILQVVLGHFVTDVSVKDTVVRIIPLVGFTMWMGIQHLSKYMQSQADLKAKDVTVKDVTKNHQSIDEPFDAILFSKKG